METRNDRLVPPRAVHPGEILHEELIERGIKQKDLARAIGVQPTHLNEFIRGKRGINDDLALKLEQQLGIPYKTWMRLQAGYNYESRVLEERRTEEQRAQRYESACADIFNIYALYKRLGLSALSCSERVKKLKSLFSFDLLSSQELRLHVSGLYKHSEKVQVDEKNMLTWLILNTLEIENVPQLKNYVKGNATKAAKDIAYMANKQELSVDGIRECLNRYGIGYVVVRKFDKAPIDAYSTYRENMPVISVSYRYNDMDKLAFDILHELYHIDYHFTEGDKTGFISVEGMEYSSDPREKAANKFARDMLIPETLWGQILKEGSINISPYTIVKTIASAAAKRGISPSIAVSRYKHDANWYKTAAYKSPRIF